MRNNTENHAKKSVKTHKMNPSNQPKIDPKSFQNEILAQILVCHVFGIDFGPILYKLWDPFDAKNGLKTYKQ